MNTFETLLARRILPSTAIQPHQFLFSWNDRPCFARGELVALTGKAKSGKTYICSLLMALAVKQQIMGISRIQKEPLRVLWIDTEQSSDSTHEILTMRIAALIEQPVPEEQFFVYNFRQDNWQERLSLVLSCISMHQPDLVIFDGIRDVVGDINNYQEAQNVLGKMLSIASWSNACIVCVLHQNKSLEDKTLRGALGTELQNKSFETYECQKNPDTRIFTMRQTATRKYDINQKLEFTVDEHGLPVLEQANRKQEQTENTENIVQSIARGEELMRSAVFANLVKSKYPEMRNNYRYNSFLFEAFNKGIMKKETLPSGEVFYRFTYQQQELF
mgnify:CR=1 FL=1